MTQDELDLEALKKEKEKLSEKLRELQAKENEIKNRALEAANAEKREREMEKLLEVMAVHVSSGTVMIRNTYRPDIIDMLKTIPGRIYRGDGMHNMIPIKEWNGFVEKLNALPNTKFTYGLGVEKQIDWYLNAPPWLVEIEGSTIVLTYGPNTSYWLVQSIIGAEHDYDSKTIRIPLSEVFEVYKTLDQIENVVYDDDAKSTIIELIEQRSRLDKIAQQEDSNVLNTGLNGKTLKPFQRVGVEFLVASGGRTILADATGLGKTWQTLGFAELHRKNRLTKSPPETFQTLCVVKSANIPNWVKEIKQLCDVENIDPVVIQGGKLDGPTMKRIIIDREPYVIISYDTLATYDRELFKTEKSLSSTAKPLYLWAEFLEQVNFDLLIMDEAHQIKNTDTKRYQAIERFKHVPYVIPATASPVLNRTPELWPLLHMTHPTKFPSLTRFIHTYTYDGKTPRNVGKLQEMLRPMFLRRLKKDVQKDLPPINRIEVLHTLSDESYNLYVKAMQGIYESISMYNPLDIGGTEMSIMSILAQFTRLLQITAADKVDHTVEVAMDLIDESEKPGSKVLIFSKFKGTAYNIARRLGSEAVCTVRRTEEDFVSLDANKRHELFEEARFDDRIRYIVTTEAAKEGHNLEFCDWVIFNDLFWTPEAHIQCEGRAYGRLADPHNIDSIWMVADIAVEKWLKSLLDDKTAIIEAAVDGIETSRDAEHMESIGKALIMKIKNEWGR